MDFPQASNPTPSRIAITTTLAIFRVQWLDDQQILVAFTTSPICAKREGPVVGVLRLMTFDTKGSPLQTADIPFDAGEGSDFDDLAHHGIWVGPDKTVLVEFVGHYFKAGPRSRGNSSYSRQNSSPNRKSKPFRQYRITKE